MIFRNGRDTGWMTKQLEGLRLEKIKMGMAFKPAGKADLERSPV